MLHGRESLLRAAMPRPRACCLVSFAATATGFNTPWSWRTQPSRRWLSKMNLLRQSPYRYYGCDGKRGVCAISKCVASETCEEPTGAEEPSAAAAAARAAAAEVLLQFDASLDACNAYDDFDPLAFDAGEISCCVLIDVGEVLLREHLTRFNQNVCPLPSNLPTYRYCLLDYWTTEADSRACSYFRGTGKLWVFIVCHMLVDILLETPSMIYECVAQMLACTNNATVYWSTCLCGSW